MAKACPTWFHRFFFNQTGNKNYICLTTHPVSGPKHGSNKYINFLSKFQIFFTNRKRKLHTFTEWNIRFPIQNMNFSVDITKNNGIVPDGHGSNTVFKSGLVAFSDFFRINYFNIFITRFAFFLQTLFKMVMWVATFSSEGYKIRSIFWQKINIPTQRKLL